MPVVEVRHLTVRFHPSNRAFRGDSHMIRAVDDVSFDLASGQTLGLVGESGCGKTTLGCAVVGLTKATSGGVWFDGEDITTLNRTALRSRRRKFQMIFQDPQTTLDPCMTAGEIVSEALEIQKLVQSKQERRDRVLALLESVGLDSTQLHRYPHEFSGGQRQRIGIARALAVRPRLIVCDEPVSALDVSVQAQIINLLRDLQRSHGIAYLFISHDLAVVEHISHRMMVMYFGKLVEIGDTKAICKAPRHPYTQALMSAVPEIDSESKRRRIILRGEPPSPMSPPPGCPFHPRCPVAIERCRTVVPELREVGEDHQVVCHLA